MKARRLAVAVALLLAAAVAAVPAAADPADEARAVAVKFLDALAVDDTTTICGLLTPAAIARLGGQKSCVDTFTAGDTSSADQAAQVSLTMAFFGARGSAARHHGHYVGKGFGPAALARAIERAAPSLTVKLGRGPQAAAGQPVTTVVLDTHTTASRLIVYAESDDGSIFRLSAGPKGAPALKEVAKGAPQTPPPKQPAFTYTIDQITLEADASVLVRGTLKGEDAEGKLQILPVMLVVAPSGGSYLVDDVLVSLFSITGGTR